MDSTAIFGQIVRETTLMDSSYPPPIAKRLHYRKIVVPLLICTKVTISNQATHPKIAYLEPNHN